MELIRNQKEFDKLKNDMASGDVMEQPQEFPCYMEKYVSNWGMEEETAEYYYIADLADMLEELRSVKT